MIFGNLSLIIAGILIIVAVLIFFKLTEKIFKTFLFLALIIIGVIAYSGFFVIDDLSELRSRFIDNGKAIVLMSEQESLTGFMMVSDPDDFSWISEMQLGRMTKAIKERDKEALEASGVYKAILIDENAVPSGVMVKINDAQLSTQEVMQILKSNEPQITFGELSGTGNVQHVAAVVAAQYPGAPEFKSVVWASLVRELVKNHKLKLIQAYRKGDIKVFPETPVFKVLRWLPVGLLQNLGAEQSTGTRSTVNYVG